MAMLVSGGEFFKRSLDLLKRRSGRKKYINFEGGKQVEVQSASTQIGDDHKLCIKPLRLWD